MKGKPIIILVADDDEDDRLLMKDALEENLLAAEEDILRAYDLGVSSFITKPVIFDSMVEIIKMLGRYWFEIVELPSERR
jgi:CheY-like chemotaxis protein